MAATIIREENFEPADYRGELDAAPENLDVGTRLWFENDHIRVFTPTTHQTTRRSTISRTPATRRSGSPPWSCWTKDAARLAQRPG
jgi:hypothetical protein